MTYVRSRCRRCGGLVTFHPEEQEPNWLGMLGYCWCGAAHRLDAGELVELGSPQPANPVLDLREQRATVAEPRDAANATVPVRTVSPALASIRASVNAARDTSLDETKVAHWLDLATRRIEALERQLEDAARVSHEREGDRAG